MENLWTPWRMEYLQKDNKNNDIDTNKKRACIFCVDKPKTQEDFALTEEDISRLIVFKGRELYCMLNRYPYANGHLMIMPYKHVADITDLSESETLEMMELAKISSIILREECKAQGINMGANLGSAAGAGIAEHLHFHIVPRWHGDSQFLAVLADVRLIPEPLETTQARFALAFKKLLGYKSKRG